MIEKILVANRGEIACRVFRTARDMGIATVAVYSQPDANAPFVLEADEAVPLGGSTPAESYLRTELILDAAHKVGADAVHPGYGFLSENAEFAIACAEAGVTFIGPDPEAITLMGSKLAAREMMEKAGVPVLPGRDLSGVPDREVLDCAAEVGWPILVKASFGGGGRGMRVVREPDQLVDAIASARREAGAAFGNDTVFLEHYVDEPRHVEIQIFGDKQGTVTHLNERECSIQRRHQKIIEESPSPAVDENLRARMGKAAIAAGETLGYVGAGTVEFLLAPDGDFYFLEVNTRLQVEHPVTEMVTGLDLVRVQIDVANGRPLPAELSDPAIRGHAVEARLYAEDPAQGFLPAAGTLHQFEVQLGMGIRLDSGVQSGDTVSTNYDPMLAKVIAHGATREEATARLASALRRSRIDGVTTNRTLLVGILEHDDFVSGRFDTHFLERESVPELVAAGEVDDLPVRALVAALADQSANRRTARQLATIPSGFRNSPSQPQSRTFLVDDTEITVTYRLGRDRLFTVDDEDVEVEPIAIAEDRVDVVIDGVRRRFGVSLGQRSCTVSDQRGSATLVRKPRFPDAGDRIEAGSLLAPMPGTVLRVGVAAGDEVSEGDTLVVLEAMKMEHSVRAVADGLVTEVPVTTGDVVDNGQVLVVLSSPEEVEE